MRVLDSVVKKTKNKQIEKKSMMTSEDVKA